MSCDPLDSNLTSLFLLSDLSFCCVVVFHVYPRHAHPAASALCVSHRIFSIIHAASLQQHPDTCRLILINEAPPLALRPGWSCSHPSSRLKVLCTCKTQLGFISAWFSQERARCSHVRRQRCSSWPAECTFAVKEA